MRSGTEGEEKGVGGGTMTLASVDESEGADEDCSGNVGTTSAGASNRLR